MSSPAFDESEPSPALDNKRLWAELQLVKASVEAMRNQLNQFVADQPKDRDLCASALDIAAQCTAVAAQSNSIAQAAISLANKTHKETP